MSDAFLIIHANIISPFQLINNGYVFIENGLISEIGEMVNLNFNKRI